jgi:hypothetical protein
MTDKLDIRKVFPLPRTRIMLANAVRIVLDSSPEEVEILDYLTMICSLLVEEKVGQKLEEFDCQLMHNNVEEWSNLAACIAFHKGASPKAAAECLHEAIRAYGTIFRQKSASRTSTSPSAQQPQMTPEAVRQLVRNAVREETASVQGRKTTKPLVDYVRLSKNEDSEEVSEASSENEASVRSATPLKHPFKEQGVIWTPVTWQNYLYDSTQLAEWSQAMREQFVTTPELKDHPVLRAQNEATLAQFESYIQLAVSTEALNNEVTIQGAEKTLTQLQSTILFATHGKDISEQYKALKSMSALPKVERMVRKEAIRIGKQQAPKYTQPQAGKKQPTPTQTQANGWHVPAEQWQKMSAEEKKKYSELQKQAKELSSKR